MSTAGGEEAKKTRAAARPTRGAAPKAPATAEKVPSRPTPTPKAASEPRAPAPAPRDIGVDVPPPSGTCTDAHCPFHGTLRVRGQMIEGVVVSVGMQRTVVVEREHLRFIPKFERFEKRTRRIPAHAPPCLGLAVGNRVSLMECRPLSKTVSFVAVSNAGAVG